MDAKMRSFVCPYCTKPSVSNVVGQASAWDEDWPVPVEWTLLQCSECKMALLQVREDYGGGFELDEPVFVHPAPKRLSVQVPKDLRDAFDEARRCFDAKAFRATVVMIRRTLEGACRDNGATKKTLALSLKELQQNGAIDGMLAEWADLLRVVGNQGAHYSDTDRVSRDDAADALDFAEALLDHLYVMRQRFLTFKTRQGKSGK